MDLSDLKIRTAVLGSTNGTDLKGLIERYNFCPTVVISNRKNAGILQLDKYQLETSFIYHSSSGLTREQYDQEISQILNDHNIDLVILIGWMRFLSPQFVEQWKYRCMNIHPSLLPAYAGSMDLDIHRAVLERGCKITGATLIFIDEGPDTGPIIDQKAVSIYEDDTPEILKARVQEVEVELLYEAIKNFDRKKL